MVVAQDQAQLKLKNMQKFWASGVLYVETNKTLSKYFISKFHQLSKDRTLIDGVAPHTKYCPNCFSLRRPSNHTTRILPKDCSQRRIHRIKTRRKRSGILRVDPSRYRKKRPENILLIHCSDCNGVVEIPLCTRGSYLPGYKESKKLAKPAQLQQTKTPKKGFVGPPQTSCKVAWSSRPAGDVSTSSKKTKNLLKSKHQQLQTMLQGARRERARSEHSSLSDFLVSL